MKSPKKSRPDFKGKKQPNEDSSYDVEYDAELIEQSLAKQYGVLPVDQAELPYWEWARLVGGLMDDTPLGRVVAIRTEQDRERIRQFTPWQRAIRNEWNAFKARTVTQVKSEKELRQDMAALEKMLANAFGGDR